MAKTETKKERLLKEIQELSSGDRIGVMAHAFKALSDNEREDLIDHLAIEQAKNQGGQFIPLEEYLADYEARHKKRAKR